MLFPPLRVRPPSAEACLQADGAQKLVMCAAAEYFYSPSPTGPAQPSGQMSPLWVTFWASKTGKREHVCVCVRVCDAYV